MTVGFYGRVYAKNAKIPLESFHLWEKRAVAAINRLAVRNVAEIDTENVRMCICEVAEFLYENAERSGISSENNDGYSVHYEKNDTADGIYAIAEKWLSKDGLMYRGDVL